MSPNGNAGHCREAPCAERQRTSTQNINAKVTNASSYQLYWQKTLIYKITNVEEYVHLSIQMTTFSGAARVLNPAHWFRQYLHDNLFFKSIWTLSTQNWTPEQLLLATVLLERHFPILNTVWQQKIARCRSKITERALRGPAQKNARSESSTLAHETRKTQRKHFLFCWVGLCKTRKHFNQFPFVSINLIIYKDEMQLLLLRNFFRVVFRNSICARNEPHSFAKKEGRKSHWATMERTNKLHNTYHCCFGSNALYSTTQNKSKISFFSFFLFFMSI